MTQGTNHLIFTGGGGGTSFEMMHAIFSGDHCIKQFFFWKIFGMSPWHILLVKDMMCNRPWVIAIDTWKVGGNSGKLFFILVFKTTGNIYNI